MNAFLELTDLARRLAQEDPPRTVVAFERRARAETLVVCSVALVGLLSAVVSIARMGRLESVEPAAFPATLANPSAEFRALEVPRTSAPAPDSVAEFCEGIPALPSRSRPGSRDSWSERDFRAEFLALTDEGELAARVGAALDSGASRSEVLAGLQALVLRDAALAPALVGRAARELGLQSDAHGESVPRGVVAWLEREAPRRETARAALEAIALDGAVATQVRAAALRAWIAALPDDELGLAVARFGREADETVYASALSSLELRQHRADEDWRD